MLEFKKGRIHAEGADGLANKGWIDAGVLRAG